MSGLGWYRWAKTAAIAKTNTLWRMQSRLFGVLALVAALGTVGSLRGWSWATRAFGSAWVPTPGTWAVLALVLGLGSGVMAYAVRHMAGSVGYARFHVRLACLAVAVAVTWSTNDARVLLAGWLASLGVLVLLIGHFDDAPRPRASTRTVAGSLLTAWFMLAAATVTIGRVAGTWRLDRMMGEFVQVSSSHRWLWSTPVLERAGSAVELQWMTVLVGGLVAVSALWFSAVWPGHRWLLHTLAAPTPVSAFMHAGVVNSGALIVARYSPVLEAAPFWLHALAGAGLVTSILGVWMMMVQPEVKRQLVCSTIAQMGFMMLQCGLGAYSWAGAHLVLHGLFKSYLFLNAGSALRREVPAPVRKTESTRMPRLRWVGPASVIAAVVATVILGAVEFGAVEWPGASRLLRSIDSLRSTSSHALLYLVLALATLQMVVSLHRGSWSARAWWFAVMTATLGVVVYVATQRSVALVFRESYADAYLPWTWFHTALAALLTLSFALHGWLSARPNVWSRAWALRLYAWLIRSAQPRAECADYDLRDRASSLRTLAGELHA